jgi:hypothetical protein
MSVDLKKFLNMYKFNTVLPGSGVKVNFKPISTFQMKELISTADSEPEEAVDRMINECVVDEGFDVKNLSLQDRFFLLVELRKKSKGSSYEITYTCEKCKSQVITKVDLEKLVVKKLDKNFDPKIKLDDNLSVEVCLITRNLQKEATELVNLMVAAGEIKEDDVYMNEVVFGYILSIQKIITPDGTIDKPDLEQKVMLFKDGPQLFYDNIIEWFNKLDFGVDFTNIITCVHCGNETKESITLQNFFY